MRIAYVIIDCDGHDGTAVAMAHVMHRLARSGRHEVHLFADNADGADLSLVRWHRVRALPDPSVARFATFFANCNRRLGAVRGDTRFDIVHSAGCNTAHANVYQVQNVQPAKREMLERHDQFAGGGWARTAMRRAYYSLTTAAERRVYRRSRDVTCGARGGRVHFLPVSMGTRRELQRFYALPDDHITVIPNGVDLDRFHPRLRTTLSENVRQTLGIRPSELMLLFVGGEWRRKGLQHAIEALTHLPAAGVMNARLVIIGRDAERPAFETLTRSAGVTDRVVFAGFQERTEHLYAAADAMVFPTYYEAYSLATLEAGAAGLPVIAAATNGTEDLIRETDADGIGRNGALVARDGRVIARAIAALINRAGGLEAAGIAARQIVEAEHGWDGIAERTERAYVDLLAKGRS